MSFGTPSPKNANVFLLKVHTPENNTVEENKYQFWSPYFKGKSDKTIKSFIFLQGGSYKREATSSKPKNDPDFYLLNSNYLVLVTLKRDYE